MKIETVFSPLLTDFDDVDLLRDAYSKFTNQSEELRGLLISIVISWNRDRCLELVDERVDQISEKCKELQTTTSLIETLARQVTER